MIFPGRVRAPSLPDDPALWLNADRPERRGLRKGVVTLLDFWTYGCVNCLHVLPDLAFLEEKYADRPFQIIGVHSGKFTREKRADAVRQAVERLGIRHAVVRDDDYRVWQNYAVRAWPTFVLVDADGYVVAVARGENHRDDLDRAVASLLDGLPDVEPSAVPPPSAAPKRDLSFPGKVLAAPDGRVLVADTGNGRIVWANGGCAAPCGFRGPQGMALDPADPNTLFVADTGNHAIRRVDLRTGESAVVAENLNSPWDLVFIGTTLYIAMAGAHRIATIEDTTTGAVTWFAGSGTEGRRDGPGADAAFAQPSGLATDGETLFVADAESGCIRAVRPDASVRTIAGGDLFDFGFADGVGDAARFQHPLGLAWDQKRGRLLVADTYNHRIRAVDPGSGRVSTVIADRVDEPGGLSVSPDGNRLWVADTNRHRIRAFDLDIEGRRAAA